MVTPDEGSPGRLQIIIMQEIQKALQEYSLTEYSPVHLMRESADNTVFVVGEHDRKILRVSKRLAAEDITFEYEAVEHLARNGVPVARWLTTKAGGMCTSVNGHVAVLFDFLSGHHVTVDKDHLPSREVCYEAGVGLGLMSNAARTFVSTSPRTRNIFAELERVISLEKTFTEQFEVGDEFVTQVKDALKFGKEQNEIIGFIHNDYRPSNVFFGEDVTVTGIIDFDWSCMGPIIKDLALAIVEWSFPDGAVEADFVLFDAFLEGYNSISDRKWQKDQTLYSWIKLSTLSDASTYFCDLAEDPDSVKRIIKSYMYRKYSFFSQL